MKRYVSFQSNFLQRLGNFMCRWTHHKITRPVQGHYVCLECMRRYSVDF
ncbi:MAG: hypothetical protein LAP39_26210 [Acidobacteriia bacterium]|nr:hypothetical protein [Terriglobia bacterium]